MNLLHLTIVIALVALSTSTTPSIAQAEVGEGGHHGDNEARQVDGENNGGGSLGRARGMVIPEVTYDSYGKRSQHLSWEEEKMAGTGTWKKMTSSGGRSAAVDVVVDVIKERSREETEEDGGGDRVVVIFDEDNINDVIISPARHKEENFHHHRSSASQGIIIPQMVGEGQQDKDEDDHDYDDSSRRPGQRHKKQVPSVVEEGLQLLRSGERIGGGSDESRKKNSTSSSSSSSSMMSSSSDAADACSAHQSCEECYKSSYECHFCSTDQRCHAKGSIHGCMEGTSCPSPSPTKTLTPTKAPTTTTPSPSKPKPHDDNKNNNTCASQTTCRDCYSSSLGCHYCEFDRKCHAKGSVHGCLEGMACPKDPTSPTKAPTEQHGCAAQHSCSDCSKFTKCHWCAFDEKCHAKGSVYGCALGVSCYANHECQRQSPEKVHKITVPPIALVVCLGLAAIVLCCLTTTFCVTTCVKGAYDDLAGKAVEASNATYAALGDRTLLMEESFRPRSRITFARQQGVVVGGGHHDDDGGGGGGNEETTSDVMVLGRQKSRMKAMELIDVPSSAGYLRLEEEGGDEQGRQRRTSAREGRRSGRALDDASSLTESLLDSPSWMLDDGPPRVIDENRPLLVDPSVMSAREAKSSHAECLYGCCKVCYLFTAVVVVVMSILSICYFPRPPEYNVCSTGFDWKSVVDGMTSLKVEGSFQILFSIYNPNRFDVDILQGSGKFAHDGTYVGRYEIPPNTVVAAQSISDVLVTTTFTPDKWSALALTTEYYKGTLAFVVSSAVTLSSPFLGGYTYDANFNDLIIHVTKTDMDRSLCACAK